ncbi:hypothetical protein AB1K89_05920 [Sporosarcina sp. 179-K 8C2 HS]|uniref:hypothetical protein n=1 Tax=Sporosarcina sp. 179-K 8C2 HS TaxID=3142387 RepID=UPI00399FA4E7
MSYQKEWGIIISKKTSKFVTVYLDLVSLKRFFFRVKDSEVFNAVISYTLMRDSCLIIYQVHKDILGTTEGIPFAIKEFRNKIKLFEKGGNQKIYEEILKQQIDDFGVAADNIGFYLDEKGQTIGSTLYVGHLLRRLKSLKEHKKDDKPGIYYLSMEVGSQLQGFIEGLERSIPMLQKYNSSESGIKELEAFKLIYKDINHTILFDRNNVENVFKYRLLLILQESFGVSWISRSYNSRIIDRDFIDDYFLNRFITIRMDSIVDSLMNLKKFSTSQFEELNNNGQGELSKALEVYMLNSFEKVAELRNTIHYDDVKTFYDYFVENEDFINLNLILEINNKIRHCIDEFINISTLPTRY